MRKVIYSMAVSLDGCIVGPDGKRDRPAPDRELRRFHHTQTRKLAAHSWGVGCMRTCCPGRRGRRASSSGVAKSRGLTGADRGCPQRGPRDRVLISAARVARADGSRAPMGRTRRGHELALTEARDPWCISGVLGGSSASRPAAVVHLCIKGRRARRKARALKAARSSPSPPGTRQSPLGIRATCPRWSRGRGGWGS
jgi:hypothetical protein